MSTTQISKKTKKNNVLGEIRQLVEKDLVALDRLIIEQLASPVPLIQEITQHIIRSGGKRLRPLVVILSARSSGYSGNDHLVLAAIIEFVHTATLLHDDVVDQSKRRRGQDTANALWGNQASVLAGDFLFSRAFQLLSQHSDVATMRVLSSTTNAIAEGEVLQLMNCHDADITEEDYLSVITRKTAKLFEAAAQIGAMLGNPDQHVQQQFANYGLNLGLTFQIIDDLLDYTADPKVSGKNLGDDLAEGKTTLPLIYAMQQTTPEKKQMVRQAIEQGGLEPLPMIIDLVKSSKAQQYCLNKADEFIQQSLTTLSALPNSPYKTALNQLALFALNRQF